MSTLEVLYDPGLVVLWSGTVDSLYANFGITHGSDLVVLSKVSDVAMLVSAGLTINAKSGEITMVTFVISKYLVLCALQLTPKVDNSR